MMLTKCSDPMKIGCTNDRRPPTPRIKSRSWCKRCAVLIIQVRDYDRNRDSGNHGGRKLTLCGNCGLEYTSRSFSCPWCMADEEGIPSPITWQAIKDAIYHSDGRQCVYCDAYADTVDHVRAKSRGGHPYNPENLVPSCIPCNYGVVGSKGSKLLTEWDLERVEQACFWSEKVQTEYYRLTGVWLG
jgi:hypothetical protein